MISEEHSRKMRGGTGSYPAPDAYSLKSFPIHKRTGLDAAGAKEEVYRVSATQQGRECIPGGGMEYSALAGVRSLDTLY
jgi:hypothetical protein